jgi:tripartite-type tricarboxylate transporter receptor subunit TctC
VAGNSPAANFQVLYRDRGLAAFAILALSIAIGAPQAIAVSDFPYKPVRIFVPYGPGGVGDVTTRLVADKLGEQLKQQFVVENRPGAGGIAAMTEVLRSLPDGHTLGLMGNGQAISMSLFSKFPYDALNDFTQISLTGSFEMLVAVSDASPYKSLRDVVDAARKNPGRLNLGAINPGSTQNLSAHLFQQVTGAEYTIVPYRTTPDLVTALLRGDVDVGFDFYAGFQAAIGPGKMRIIATAGEHRDPLLDQVPTAGESGFPQYVVVSWNGLATRAGVPADVIQTLNANINRSLALPDIQQKARNLGIEATGSSPQGMHDRMAADIRKWRDVIDKAEIPKQ